MTSLAGRRFLIVGGNGFVGNCVGALLVKHDAHVSVLSRSGPRFKYPENKKINWIIGDALEAETIKEKINEADTIVHSLATLFDTSITKLRSPGEPGTYEQMNRDTFVHVLNCLEGRKQVFYISGMGHPPFCPRYQTTKQQSEELMWQSPHEGYSIRPGFIYDWGLKKWSLPLKHSIQFWNQIYPAIQRSTSPGSLLEKFFKQFQQASPTNLHHIAQSIVMIASNNNCLNKNTLEPVDIEKMHASYSEKVKA